MIRRRFTAYFAAFAVVASGLITGTAPASASISSESITPSIWPPGATEQVVVQWTESSPTANTSDSQRAWNVNTSSTGQYLSVEVGWGWNLAAKNTANDPPARYTAAWNSGSKSFICDTTPAITFSSPGFSSTGDIECLVRRASNPQSSSDPGQQVILSNTASHYFSLAANSTIEVTFASGQVTSPATGPATDTWRIISLVEAQTTLVRTTVPAVDSAGNPIPFITINIDANGGDCLTDTVTGYQGTWTTAPDSGSCVRDRSVFKGFNTKSDGSGLAVAPGGNLNLTGDNTLFAQYETARTASAPANVVAQRGYQIVSVSWTPPTDTGTSSIFAYLVRSKPDGRACITNTRSENQLECVYNKGALTPGVKYTFEVQALNSAGWGPFSAESNGATPFDVRFDSLARPKAASFLFIGGGSTIEANGKAPGLSAGTTLTPHVQIGASGKWETETRNLPKVNANGTYSWSKKLARNINGQPASVYFTFNDVKTRTLTAAVGASDGVPGAPRDLTVTSTTNGITVSWKAPSRNGGSPVTNYIVKSDLQGFSCIIAAPATSCTQFKKPRTLHDPRRNYTFSVAAKTQRGTGNEAKTTWRGELYRLNIVSRQLDGDDITLGFNAKGFSCSQKFEVQAKIGANGKWSKQPGAAALDPATCSFGRWTGAFPKVADGTMVIYRLKSPNGFSSELRAYT